MTARMRVDTTTQSTCVSSSSGFASAAASAATTKSKEVTGLAAALNSALALGLTTGLDPVDTSSNEAAFRVALLGSSEGGLRSSVGGSSGSGEEGTCVCVCVWRRRRGRIGGGGGGVCDRVVVSGE